MLTPNEFCHWLHAAFSDPAGASLPRVYEKLQEVELAESAYANALNQHEEFTSYMKAGFTAPQAFSLIQTKLYAMHHGMAVGLAGNNRPPEHG